MTDIAFHRPAWVGDRGARERPLRNHEWLLTNGLGGYASGTVADVMTRKYHGYLIAALAAPYGRMVMLQDVGVTLRFPDGHEVPLSGEERSDAVRAPGEQLLYDFRMELGLPVWEFDVEGTRVEKRVLMPHGQNTCYLSFRVTGDPPASGLEVVLRPYIHFRSYEASVTTAHDSRVSTQPAADRLEVQSSDADLVALRLFASGASYTVEPMEVAELGYHVERDRGYEWLGSAWSPGYFQLPLGDETSATFVATTETWATIEGTSFDDALSAERSRRNDLITLAKSVGDDPAERLTLAADAFIITPVGRENDAARAKAAGDESRTVIAGYHWFTDWGRDTMISLEGLTLATGRFREAGYILRTFAHYVRDGLIPNMFPDGANEGLYHTADASLWFFHAVHRYCEGTDDRRTLAAILPRLREIIAAHEAGTCFGIGVDPTDALLRQGADGYQLTWMDAKVDGFVVTPRRGKAVEINALWYNAVMLMATFERTDGTPGAADRLNALAERIRVSFNQRFWNDDTSHLYDVVDGEGGGDDAACRPNQLFAISLDYPVLDEARWPAVLSAVREKLLTPVGLRSLSRDHPDYKPKYFGDLHARDAAYHQGTVWAWLIGPFIDACLRVHPDEVAGARALLSGLIAHMDDFGVGSVAEIFDAETPFTPRGCIAQAWSVAEVLRAWKRTSREDLRH
ncbi:MAG TPA: amylo-alpha-1,6-glucosidase [Gemmatimonadaceae bacterium]|nr:amylo-alpha-1,6-glucosidase [Gemmatimonadaceae bacterium]